MKLRNAILHVSGGLFYGSVCFALGVLVEHIRNDPRGVKRLLHALKVFVRPGYSKTPIFLGFHGESNPDPQAKRIYPQLHPGGPKTTEVYDWAAKWIVKTGRDPKSIGSIRDAWAEVPYVFKNYISSEKSWANKQWERFRTQVKRRLKKWT